MPLASCDCLSDCGDDPRIARGAATPCQSYRTRERLDRLNIAAPEMLMLIKNALPDNHTAKAIINFIEGTT